MEMLLNVETDVDLCCAADLCPDWGNPATNHQMRSERGLFPPNARATDMRLNAGLCECNPGLANSGNGA